MNETPFDLLVVGGGPAGAMTATFAARSGLSVLLVDRRPGGASGGGEETLVPAVRPLLARLGIDRLFAAQDRSSPAQHRAYWGGSTPSERTGDQRDLQVSRPALDEALRQEARSHGVTVVEGVVHGSVDEDVVSVVSTTGSQGVRPRRVVVATGRLVPPSLTSTAIAEEGPKSVALTSTSDAPPAAFDGNGIEAVPAGWWWWIRSRTGGASLTLFCDGDELRARGTDEIWRESIAASSGPAKTWVEPVGGGTLVTPRRREPAGRAWLVGDAASSIDPLSSQGVEKGLASAERVALAVITAQREPALEADLRQHLIDWETGLFRAHARRASETYHSEERFVDRAFWRARRLAHAKPASMAAASAVVSGRFRLSPRLRAAPTFRPRGDSLRSVTGYALDGAPPIDRVGPLPIEDLIAAARPGGTLEGIVERAGDQPALAGWRREDVRFAFTQMLHRGWLVSAD